MRTIQRDIVGAFIFSKDDKILLGKVAVYQNHWAVPGGGIDEGETKLKALKREILEETGINIADEKVEELEGVTEGESEKNLRNTQERVLVQMNFYDFKILLSKSADEIKLKTEDDFTEAMWFSKEELQNVPLSPPTADRLQKLGYLKK